MFHKLRSLQGWSFSGWLHVKWSHDFGLCNGSHSYSWQYRTGMNRVKINGVQYNNYWSAQIALDTTYWTIFNHITIWGSVLSYFILDYFYNYVIGGPYVGSLTQAMKEATFWFTTIITVILLMVPVLGTRFYFVDVAPSLSDKVICFIYIFIMGTMF